MSVKVLIPSAGFGNRMGMNSNQSKEMLIDPVTGKPIIDWSIDLCNTMNLDYLVITRKEKQDLIDYINPENLMVIDSSKEWNDTLLQSKPKWAAHNIVLLPDTRFSPKSFVMTNMRCLLNTFKFAFALHEVEDQQNWGIYNFKDNTICEKPNDTGKGLAWGLFGFWRNSGETLLNSMSIKGKLYYLTPITGLCCVENFKDLTRTGKVLNY